MRRIVLLSVGLSLAGIAGAAHADPQVRLLGVKNSTRNNYVLDTTTEKVRYKLKGPGAAEVVSRLSALVIAGDVKVSSFHNRLSNTWTIKASGSNDGGIHRFKLDAAEIVAAATGSTAR